MSHTCANTNKTRVVSVGEVLWDILPSGRVLGGAPSNVAWHALQLGSGAHVVSAVGDDAAGRDILAALDGMGLIGTGSIGVVAGKPTGTVDARIDARGNASYVIHADVAWDYISATPEVLELVGGADAVAFGSLASRSSVSAAAIRRILAAAAPRALRVLDINLRPPHFSRETLAAVLEMCTVLKVNHEELPVLADLFGLPGGEAAALPELMRRYSGLTGIIITRGAAGAGWFDADGLVGMAPEGSVTVVDTVGAGDSFTAAAVLGLLKGWEKRKILANALRVASHVCSCRGATPVLPDALKQDFAWNGAS